MTTSANQQVLAGLRLSPSLPWWLVALLAALALAVAALAWRRRARGVGWRMLAMAVVLGWLCGPTLIQETRQTLPDIVLLIDDQSASMQTGNRAALAAAARTQLARQLAAMPGIELRNATLAPGPEDGTRLFAALDRALAGLPRERLSAIVALTDGQVHDVPSAMPVPVPLQVLLAGRPGEVDRRLRLIEAPGYGVVGRPVVIRLQVDDLGAGINPGAVARLVVRHDGETPRELVVPIGEPVALPIPVTHEGSSVVELTVDPLPGEVSDVNNRAALSITGVRDRLRVLLVSGEPHAGERTWRRLLKADPAVDLVHFTILRPPEKDDATPLNELALIAFPTRELFQQKLREFDLVIFDRFQNRGILLPPYLRNVAEYVRQGGALLLSVGPEFSGTESLDSTPLREVLPAHPVAIVDPLPTDDALGQSASPTGDPSLADEVAVIGAFRPVVTDIGLRHPVTAGLPGWRADGPPTWGPWYRRIPATDLHGQVVMTAQGTGAGSAPLLLLDRVDKGRVAMLLSDQIWLWARDHQGGGPQAELLRRVAHWLMKQPDLEEEALSATIEHRPGAPDSLVVTRRSLSTDPPPSLTVTDPDGATHSLALRPASPGSASPSLSSARSPATRPGVWQVSDGQHTAYAAAAAADTRETQDLRASDRPLASLAQASGGGQHWLATQPAPELRRVGAGRVAFGRDWLGLPVRATQVTSAISATALLPDWVALVVLLGTVVLAWWRESR